MPRVVRSAADPDDVPPPLLAFQLDGLAKLCITEELRGEVPLLLSGSVIEELRLLVGKLGGPTTVSRRDGRSQTLAGMCTGLARMGLLSGPTLQASSDAELFAPISEAIERVQFQLPD